MSCNVSLTRVVYRLKRIRGDTDDFALNWKRCAVIHRKVLKHHHWTSTVVTGKPPSLDHKEVPTKGAFSCSTFKFLKRKLTASHKFLSKILKHYTHHTLIFKRWAVKYIDGFDNQWAVRYLWWWHNPRPTRMVHLHLQTKHKSLIVSKVTIVRFLKIEFFRFYTPQSYHQFPMGFMAFH